MLLKWALLFLILATISALCSYHKPATTYSYIAKLLFFTFLVIFFVFIVAELFSTTPLPSESLPSSATT